MSVATFSNRLFGTITASSFLSIAAALSWAGFFLLLSLACLLCAVFVYWIVPETKGHSLEDMSLYFAEITKDHSILDITDVNEDGVEVGNGVKDSMHAFS